MHNLTLRWETFHGASEQAWLGQVPIGAIGRLDADPSTWWYKVDGVYMKWISKGFGHVKGRASAKRAVERAWDTWSERANLKAADGA